MAKPEIRLRCYAQRDEDGSWFAICLDLNLYARDESFERVRAKLDRFMREYMAEALGPDRDHLADLYPRRAPLRFWLRYGAVALRDLIVRRRDDDHCDGGAVPFSEHLPLHA